MARRTNWEPGNVVEIALPAGRYAYGKVVSFPLVAFYGARQGKITDLAILAEEHAVFRIWVMKHAIGKKGWLPIGSTALSKEDNAAPAFFKRDSIDGSLSIYRAGQFSSATEMECAGLECAAVWDPSHVESRLIDLFDNRPNKWVLSLALKNSPNQSTDPAP